MSDESRQIADPNDAACTPVPSEPAASPPAPRKKLKRRFLQFSLSTLFIIVTLACLAAYQAHVWLKRMQDEEDAIATLLACPNARVRIVRGDPTNNWPCESLPPAWFRSLVGKQRFQCAGKVEVTPPERLRGARARAQSNMYEEGEAGMSPAELRLLRSMPHLTELNLSLPLLSDESLAELSPPSLMILGLRSRTSTVTSWAPLAKFYRLQHLGISISNTAPSSWQTLSSLKTIQTLEVLAISASDLTNEDLPAIATLSNVRVLDLVETKIDARGLPHLHQMQNLQALTLDGVKLVDSDLAAVSGMKSLQSLYIWRSPLLTKKAMEYLTNLKRLEVLWIVLVRQKGISQDDIPALKKNMPSLREVFPLGDIRPGAQNPILTKD